MKRTLSIMLTVVFAVSALSAMPAQAEENMVVKETSIGTLQFQRSFPTKETSKLLKKERRSQRAIQTYIWAIPIASMADYLYTFRESLGYKMGDFFRLNAD